MSKKITIKQGKLIYAKWVKETLEDIYDLHPVLIVENPRDHDLNAWVFEKSDALYDAIAEISHDKGEKTYGKCKTS